MLSAIASWIIRILGATLRVLQINEQFWQGAKRSGKAVIFGFWHGEQFILCHRHRAQNVAIMSSLSRDGELQSGILTKLGYFVVRGSSSKGAQRALVEMIRASRAGRSAAFAVDGPRGPYHKAKAGIIYLAQKTGLPIIPVSCAANARSILSKAWDKYEFPWPFSKCVIAYGKPIFAGKGDINAKAADFERELDKLSRFTHQYYFSKDIGAYLEHHPNPKILIVQPSRIGDVVFTLPSVVALRKKYPHAWIGWVVDERCAPIIEKHPAIDEVIVFDRAKLSLKYILAFRRKLREKQIDLSIDFHGLSKSAFVVWLAGAHFRLGSSSTYGMKELSWLFSKEIPSPTPEAHCVQRHFEVARLLGCAGHPDSYQIAVDSICDSEARQICKQAGLDTSKPIAVVHPGGGWLSRRWPAGSFAALSDRLAAECGLQIAIIGGREGGANEGGIAAEVIKNTRVPVIDLTGKMTLTQLIAFLSFAGIFVGNEAGPMHIAVALGRPVVAIIGPTNPKRTGPFGGNTKIVRANVACQPCRNRNCKTMECMKLINVDDVFNAANELLKGNLRTPSIPL